MGMTVACFHSNGSSPVSYDFLKSIVRGRASASAQDLSKMEGMLSGPAALPSSSLLNSSRTGD